MLVTTLVNGNGGGCSALTNFYGHLAPYWALTFNNLCKWIASTLNHVVASRSYASTYSYELWKQWWRYWQEVIAIRGGWVFYHTCTPVINSDCPGIHCLFSRLSPSMEGWGGGLSLFISAAAQSKLWTLPLWRYGNQKWNTFWRTV